jgi:hypothetical protein
VKEKHGEKKPEEGRGNGEKQNEERMRLRRRIRKLRYKEKV